VNSKPQRKQQNLLQKLHFAISSPSDFTNVIVVDVDVSLQKCIVGSSIEEEAICCI
jgi:hypothetical protein